ncbi:MAG: hypothetical protein J5I52_07190 [Saprospiraceae bacterium]|nr:MAG: hypothetical protein UZ09_BCD002001026 [Bacteroidetes bacterium OLB9]MCO6463917.1 hypothetical protein [Saprospiraceae bacterium]MCZ2339379.1 hypothetical protein [Chitinophagales bacterium]
MRKFKFLSLITVFIFSVSSCSSDIVLDKENNQYQTAENRADTKKGKDEQACIIDDKAGIRCFESVGNSCKKIHACIPVKGAPIYAEKYFSEDELQNWFSVDYHKNRAFMIHMWKSGYFVHPDSIK